MAGQNPPLPRTYPIFRLATVVASLLFFFSFGINSFGAQLAASQVPAFGMGGGGSEPETFAQEAAPAMEEPAAPEAMAPAPAEPEAAMDAAGSEEAPLLEVAPQTTQIPQPDDASRLIETPFAKNGETENAVEQEATLIRQETPRLISSTWQIGLAVLAALGFILLGIMRQFSARRWK
jgi:hypothetical protein